jgi:hypothetical protein
VSGVTGFSLEFQVSTTSLVRATAQREQRRIEKEEGREWERRFFNRIEESAEDAQRPRPSPPTLW